jgi:hypothetical protein
VVVAAPDSDVRRATVETYRAATRTRLQYKFDKTSGDERGAATYAELFTTGRIYGISRNSFLFARRVITWKVFSGQKQSHFKY